MKKLFAFCFLAVFLALFSSPLFAAQTKKPVKHAAVAHSIRQHALVRLFTKGGNTGLKGITYAFLFGTETLIVDPAHTGFSAADKVGDVLMLSKLPGLNGVYSIVSYGNTGFAWLDTHEELAEMDLFGTHN
jgi:hypothetical protein